MKKTIISMIAAIGENRGLGKDNKLLWNIPEDMKRFRELTKGHVVIMGRKTFESIGRLLPSRFNIIITRDKKFKVSGKVQSINRLNDYLVCHSMDEAITNSFSVIRTLKIPNEIFIIGGGQIYEQGMSYADKLYLTIVKGKFDADTFFPDYSAFREVISKKESRDENYQYIFLDLEKR